MNPIRKYSLLEVCRLLDDLPFSSTIQHVRVILVLPNTNNWVVRLTDNYQLFSDELMPNRLSQSIRHRLHFALGRLVRRWTVRNIRAGFGVEDEFVVVYEVSLEEYGKLATGNQNWEVWVDFSGNHIMKVKRQESPPPGQVFVRNVYEQIREMRLDEWLLIRLLLKN